jgi:hypothetical protein
MPVNFDGHLGRREGIFGTHPEARIGAGRSGWSTVS